MTGQAGRLRQMQALQDGMLAILEDLVMVESPTDDAQLIRRCAAYVSTITHRLLGQVPETVDVDGRVHLRLRAGERTSVLVLCHFDTVWPRGTTSRWPFAVQDGVASGPGAFDMKAGLVQALYAASALADPRGVTLLMTSDEETGSATSRALIEQEAAGADAVLVPEPSADGALKTARKGVSHYRLRVRGRAAHPGLDPEKGVNALVELAHQVLFLSSLADTECGTNVTPTLARAGSTANTVPAAGQVDVDVRAWTVEEQARVQDAILGAAPVLEAAQLEATGTAHRPPLEASASTGLFALAQEVARELGLPALEAAAVGGGSDGNFTAALGVPTLDGLGAVGGNAHAEGEHVVLAAMPERAALLAELLERLDAGDGRPGTTRPARRSR